MKKTIYALGLFYVISINYSCKNETKDNNDKTSTEIVDQTTEESHIASNGLALDNGKRWIANPETTKGVENMIAIMNSFDEKENAKSYEKLTKDLKSEFTMIFAKCTMKGEAHEQLHHFLIPIKDLLETLPSSDLMIAQKSFDDLKHQLSIYKKYFK